MTTETLKQAAHAEPFRPFQIHIADGRNANVPGPDFISIHPNGRHLIVHTVEGGSRVISMSMVTEIEFQQVA